MKKALNLIYYVLGIVLLICTLFISPTEASEIKSPINSDQNCVVELRELMLSFAQKKQKSARIEFLVCPRDDPLTRNVAAIDEASEGLLRIAPAPCLNMYEPHRCSHLSRLTRPCLDTFQRPQNSS